jgi:2-polyprenyl-6-methoxyphenol hydroxylase-like FAD-dependent oxidoreductase
MSSCLVPTEEAEYEHWTWGRFVCLGDSIHKVTPNMGAGGNAAIESAAALANAIKKMVDECNSARPSLEAVKSGLQEYEKLGAHLYRI